jgi:hypothetical protein
VVEYAGRTGRPNWSAPKAFQWAYTRFGKLGGTAPAPDETIEMTFVKNNAANNGFNEWTVNGVAFLMEKMAPMFHLHRGKRYRLRMRNASDDIHPVHLHRHSFELSRIAGKATAGVIKDVVMLGGYQEIEVDFVADNPGLTLFHCHHSCTWTSVSWRCLIMCEWCIWKQRRNRRRSFRDVGSNRNLSR